MGILFVEDSDGFSSGTGVYHAGIEVDDRVFDLVAAGIEGYVMKILKRVS